jgi:CheY-like chemotaxis protein
VPTDIKIDSDDWVSHSDFVGEMVKKYIWPLFPESIKTELSNWEIIAAASDFGHFALLFKSPSGSSRRVITDTQLIHLDNVFGFNYTDIQPDGKVFLRSKTDHGHNTRAFFDGVHLMTTEQFQTCAPKVFFFEGGYKVNSTKVTIINGSVYPLVDKDDEVAYTTGSCGIFGSFSFKQLQAGIELSQQSTKYLSVIEGQVFLGQTKLKAMGQFLPSEQKMLDNGFVRYAYSQFVLTNQVLCDSVLVVDDSQAWIDKVSAEFGSEISSLEFFKTTDSEAALQKIAQSNADIILLDMHLTFDERFDGLWIIKELATRGFKIPILICSSYGDEVLAGFLKIAQAYLKNVEAPGKNLEQIRHILSEI